MELKNIQDMVGDFKNKEQTQPVPGPGPCPGTPGEVRGGRRNSLCSPEMSSPLEKWNTLRAQRWNQK